MHVFTYCFVCFLTKYSVFEEHFYTVLYLLIYKPSLMYTLSYDYTTIFTDLDTQRHVNSNRYFDLFESGKYLLLSEMGIDKNELFNDGAILQQISSKFRFIKQLVENTKVTVRVELDIYRNGYLAWQGVIIRDGKDCFEISSLNRLDPDFVHQFVSIDEDYRNGIPAFDRLDDESRVFEKEYEIRHIDRNCFGTVHENMAWKVFEDTRWLQSKSLGLSLEKLVDFDVSFFWRDAEYRFFRCLTEDTVVKSRVWLRRVEKYRVFFGHEIVDTEGNLICNANSCFLPVSIKRMRLIPVPQKIIGIYESCIQELAV